MLENVLVDVYQHLTRHNYHAHHAWFVCRHEHTGGTKRNNTDIRKLLQTKHTHSTVYHGPSRLLECLTDIHFHVLIHLPSLEPFRREDEPQDDFFARLSELVRLVRVQNQYL